MSWLGRKNRLHYWRSIRWYTQKELAKKVGVSATTVSLWECDTVVPTTEHALRVAKILRVSVRDLWALGLCLLTFLFYKTRKQ